MTNTHFVFAGGGTGGHLFPGLAVAEAVRKRAPDARISFFTTTRALDRDLLGSTPYEQVPQPVQPLTLHPLRLPGFWWSWHKSVQVAGARFRANPPGVVLGLGGYAAGPPVVAARALGIRTAILNPDAIPGRANRHLARYADLVVLQWDVSRERFRPGTHCETFGCPIRSAFAAPDALEGRKHFGLDSGRPVLLATGASQGAHTLNAALMAVWPAFHATHPEWQLLHLTGPADETEVRHAYAAAGSPAQVVSFTAEMPLAIAAADLVISRAGASTLAELTLLGKPSILLPYPYHRDRHQHANAGVLVDGGAAVLIEDRLQPELNAPALRAAIDSLAEATKRRQMAAAAAKLGKQTAAHDVAAWLLG
jgi:UDP-N-acetylglucosamine--N-acetylmuramyl-(pentapeptide) pyrophosphoryl-undecaprenol N-acetylglucosamine transferase